MKDRKRDKTSSSERKPTVNSRLRAYCFVDGGQLRAIAQAEGKALPNPRTLATTVVDSYLVQRWLSSRVVTDQNYKYDKDLERPIGLARVIYYDGKPADTVPEELQRYWDAVELLQDTEIGFGFLRGRRRRQKGVDTLIAVDMLVGAFTGLFDIAVLISGDGDFVPVVQEVKRRGVMVVAVSTSKSLCKDLRTAADRVWELDTTKTAEFPPLLVPGGEVWRQDSSGEISRGPL